jgi:hypothetical protein
MLLACREHLLFACSYYAQCAVGYMTVGLANTTRSRTVGGFKGIHANYRYAFLQLPLPWLIRGRTTVARSQSIF